MQWCDTGAPTGNHAPGGGAREEARRRLGGWVTSGARRGKGQRRAVRTARGGQCGPLARPPMTRDMEYSRRGTGGEALRAAGQGKRNQGRGPIIPHGRGGSATRMLGVPPWNAEQAERWRAHGHDPAGDAPKDVPLPVKRAIRRMGADSDTRLERQVRCHLARVTGMACAGPSAREPTRSTWAGAARWPGPAKAEVQRADVCLRDPRAGCD